MNIYLLSQDVNKGYDTFNACVVGAESEEDAKTIAPTNCSMDDIYTTSTWARHTEDVKCKCIGKADPSIQRGLIIASFNAG